MLDMQRQGILRKNDSYVDWRVVLSTKLQYGIEALTRVMRGKKLQFISFF